MNDEFPEELTPTRRLNNDVEPRFHHATSTYVEPLPVVSHRPAPPNAARIYEMIMRAAERQIATAAVAQPIIAAGLEDALQSLMAQIAANAANPLADLFEDALADCSK